MKRLILSAVVLAAIVAGVLYLVLGKEDFSELVSTLKDGTPEERAAALGKLKDTFKDKVSSADVDAALPALKSALGDASDEVRQKAADVIATIGPKAKAAVPELIGLLDEKSAPLRKSAIEALGNMGAEAVAAAPGLISALATEHADDAKAALDKVGIEKALPSLLAALDDSREEVAKAARAHLDGSRASIEALTSHDDEAVRNAAGAALKRLNGGAISSGG